MTIPLETARHLVQSLQSGQILSQFAQSHAKRVLYNIKEDPGNYPFFTPELDDRVTFAAYALLAAGCSMLEQQAVGEGTKVVESAASFLDNIHGPLVETSRESSFHVLVSSMGHYVAGHYSRAFISIRSVEKTTDAAALVAAFIRKEFHGLHQSLGAMLFGARPDLTDQGSLDEWAITVAIARSISFVLEYLAEGNESHLEQCDKTLSDAMLIAKASLSPAYWWIVRLLKLMFDGLEEASLWKNLPPFFPYDRGSHLSEYIRLLSYSEPPVIELWTSQRAALSLALNFSNRGGVINLRTGAGKTRVAELAMLKVLSADSSCKVLYLAPFRSLAFELERSLSGTFSWLGFQVSHLYGGARVSSIDWELVTDSAVIIATPEKAKALYRASPEVLQDVRLIIIDEGHLIGPDARLIRNEVFYDHLRSIARSTGARILLLSAVLPNSQELAQWVADDRRAVAVSHWKPATEQLGILKWDGEKARIDWIDEVRSFNPSFVRAEPVSSRKNSTKFPSDKAQAVAAAAVRLMELGPVLIFAGQARWVSSMARKVLRAMEMKSQQEFRWPKDAEREWKVFEATCSEEMGFDSVVLDAARHGVICHSALLTPQVRVAIERLMRCCPPRVIVATSTLGQGVNLGVSSVIVASPLIGKQKRIGKREFWNICGRAGRPYVDGEGTILCAIDGHRRKGRTHKAIEKDEAEARSYLDSGSIDRVESGLLDMISNLRQIAKRAAVSFDVLLELVANNDFACLGEGARECEKTLDLIDDELLALHQGFSEDQLANDPTGWVEQVFRDSLAAIQASAGLSAPLTADDVVCFLEARARSVLVRVPDERTRRAIVASGLPLSVAMKAYDDLDLFREATDVYLQSDRSLAFLINVVRMCEEWARHEGTALLAKMPEQSELDCVRDDWLGGVGLSILSRNDPKLVDVCRDFYGSTLSWVIHAISQKLDKSAEPERVKVLGEIALLVEIGVPTERAARLFLAGVRSRVAATELAGLSVDFGTMIAEIRRHLRSPAFVQRLIPQVSTVTAKWLDLILADGPGWVESAPSFRPFRLPGLETADALYVRTQEGRVVLCSVDGSVVIPVESTPEWPFEQVKDDRRFVFSRVEDAWYLTPRDPQLGHDAE